MYACVHVCLTIRHSHHTKTPVSEELKLKYANHSISKLSYFIMFCNIGLRIKPSRNFFFSVFTQDYSLDVSLCLYL